MINFIKRDFISVRANLSYVIGKNVPMWASILWYIIIGLLALPLMPFVLVYTKIKLRNMKF